MIKAFNKELSITLFIQGLFRLGISDDHFVLRFRQQALFHILAAYSMYNTEVGYCQGMSQIAAIFLMYMNEEVLQLIVY